DRSGEKDHDAGVEQRGCERHAGPEEQRDAGGEEDGARADAGPQHGADDTFELRAWRCRRRHQRALMNMSPEMISRTAAIISLSHLTDAFPPNRIPPHDPI